MENESGWGGKRANSGGARPGAGRPKGSLSRGERRTGRLVISCLESEEKRIRALAEKAGKNVSRFLVELALGSE